jgi:hypothetical protein
MHAPQLLAMARRFRKGIELIQPSQRPICMQSFPCGACGDTSLLFGAYLVDHGMHGFLYVSGDRGSKNDNSWTSHAWLQKGQLVIDLTADQFPDAPTDVIVAEPSKWHKTFSTDREQCSDFREWSGFGADILHPMYAQILKELENA